MGSEMCIRDSGNCIETATAERASARISGTITFVKGHLVTLQQSTRTLVISDEPALESQATGRVAVGRQVEAHGYWDGGTFYATRFESVHR